MTIDAWCRWLMTPLMVAVAFAPLLTGCGNSEKIATSAAGAQALVREYADADAKYADAWDKLRSRGPFTDKEFQDVQKLRLGPVPHADQWVDWAGRNPEAPESKALLVTILRHGQMGKDAQSAADLLARDHLDLEWQQFSDLVTQNITAWPKPVVEKWIRAYLERSPDRQTRAAAAVILAGYKTWLMERAGEELEPDWVKRIESNFGKGSMSYLDSLDRDELAREAGELYQQVLDEFSDVKLGQQPLAEVARPWVFELTNLAIGKPLPDISGKDLAGEPLALSDYRGKVIVLAFWASWCPPCMAMVPHEKELVARFAKKPFAFIGVNGDNTLAEAQRAVKEKEMTWPSFQNDGSGQDLISNQWNVRHWPTIYVADSKGIIRFKDIRGKELDQAVDQLLKEIDRNGG